MQEFHERHRIFKGRLETLKENIHGIKIIKIIYTGAKVVGYKEFVDVVSKLKKGDVLVFDSASRMSRNSEEGCKLYEDLFNRDVDIEFLKEPQINTSVYRQALQNQIKIRLETGNKATDELMNTIIEALNKFTIELAKEQIKKVFDQAEKELEDLHIRTSEGLETARLNGKQIGQIKGINLVTEKEKKAKPLIIKYSKAFDGSLSDLDCIKLIGISKNTYYTYKRELKLEMVS